MTDPIYLKISLKDDLAESDLRIKMLELFSLTKLPVS